MESHLWKTVLVTSKPPNRGLPDQSDTDDEEHIAYGLGYADRVATTGMIWLPTDQFDWVPYPRYTPKAFEAAARPKNTVYYRLKRLSNPEDKLFPRFRLYDNLRTAL